MTRCLALCAAMVFWACSGDAGPTLPTDTPPPGVRLELATVDSLVFEAGGTSPAPVRVRATLDDGPVVGVRVAFDLPSSLGRLSQTSGPTDEQGWAESWILDARPGTGGIVASLGDARVEQGVRIVRAPGRVEIEPSPGPVGRPGFAPPDSILRARVFDTEGDPMEGQPVFFAWAGTTRVGIDTTDASGYATGILGPSPLEAGEWPVFALLPGRPVSAVDVRRTEPVARRIVLAAVDGLSGDALERLKLPTLAALASGGAGTSRMRSIDPTLSVPANLSTLAGEGPESHRLFSEELLFTPEMNRLDPLFRIGLRRGLTTAGIIAAEGHLARFDETLECRLAFGFDVLLSVAGAASDLVDATLPLLGADGPDMLYLQFSDLDAAGHTHGWASEPWDSVALALDAELARLVAALPPDALLAVYSAHGGGGAFGPFQHGSGAPADAEVPLLLHGPGVRAGTSIDDVDLLDLAPTLGWALGWAPSDRWFGTPVLEAFGGTRPRQSGPITP